MSKEKGSEFVQQLPQAAPTGDGSGSPTQAVLAYYQAINARDIEAAATIMAPTVQYEDFGVYNNALEGREELVSKLLSKWTEFPDDVQFILDDYTVSGDNEVGAVWHVEVNGTPMPFSRGCSYYRCAKSHKFPRHWLALSST
eukprot:2202464-Pyramimonas_sp.AAC.1